MEARSCRKRFRTRPAGVRSKKAIGARSTRESMASCTSQEARICGPRIEKVAKSPADSAERKHHGLEAGQQRVRGADPGVHGEIPPLRLRPRVRGPDAQPDRACHLAAVFFFCDALVNYALRLYSFVNFLGTLSVSTTVDW